MWVQLWVQAGIRWDLPEGFKVNLLIIQPFLKERNSGNVMIYCLLSKLSFSFGNMQLLLKVMQPLAQTLDICGHKGCIMLHMLIEIIEV